jgi:Family of unknown function (DUF6461)
MGFEWADGVPAVCLTFVEGLSPEQVERRLGADPGSRRSTTFEQAVEDQDFVGERFAIQVGVIDGWTVLVEPNGYVCSQDAVLADLSTEGRAVMVFWNVNLDSRFGYAREGVLVRVFDPVLRTSEVGDPLPEEAGTADGQPIHAALALAEALTGVRVTGAWLLDEARPTVTCPLAAP